MRYRWICFKIFDWIELFPIFLFLVCLNYYTLFVFVLYWMQCFWSIWTPYTVIAQLWCAQFSCSFSPSEQHIFFTPISVQSDPHCKQAREILSSFQPCNETNDCLLARQCRGRLRTRQVQLRLKLLCLNLTGQKGDFRKVASWGKCKWAPRKHCRQFVHAGSLCVCVCVKSELVCLTWS